MLNKRLRELRDFTQQRLFKKYRHDWTFDFVGEFKGKNLSLEKRAALAFKISCEALEPIVFPDEKISFVRTVNNVPAYYERKEAKKRWVWKGCSTAPVEQSDHKLGKAPERGLIRPFGTLSRKTVKNQR